MRLSVDKLFHTCPGAHDHVTCKAGLLAIRIESRHGSEQLQLLRFAVVFGMFRRQCPVDRLSIRFHDMLFERQVTFEHHLVPFIIVVHMVAGNGHSPVSLLRAVFRLCGVSVGRSNGVLLGSRALIGFRSRLSSAHICAIPGRIGSRSRLQHDDDMVRNHRQLHLTVIDMGFVPGHMMLRVVEHKVSLRVQNLGFAIVMCGHAGDEGIPFSIDKVATGIDARLLIMAPLVHIQVGPILIDRLHGGRNAFQ